MRSGGRSAEIRFEGGFGGAVVDVGKVLEVGGEVGVSGGNFGGGKEVVVDGGVLQLAGVELLVLELLAEVVSSCGGGDFFCFLA